MKDNYLPQALYLFTYSILVLFILSFIPPFTIGNFTFKEINLVSDLQSEPEMLEAIKTDSAVDSLMDSTLLEKTIVLAKIDTCKTGITCIEDYSPEGNALDSFVESLDRVK